VAPVGWHPNPVVVHPQADTRKVDSPEEVDPEEIDRATQPEDHQPRAAVHPADRDDSAVAVTRCCMVPQIRTHGGVSYR
jgi:hypothetical protein